MVILSDALKIIDSWSEDEIPALESFIKPELTNQAKL